MYEAFFGLTGKPFSTLPDPDFMFESSNHVAVFRTIERDLDTGAELSVITGPTGCGKTTLVQKFLRGVDDQVTVGLIPNTYRDLQDLPRWVLLSFDQKPVEGTSREIYQQLLSYLSAEHAGGRRCLLIIDEAQNLALSALKELSLLCSANVGEEPLLQILLVGQPELLDNLRQPELADLARCITTKHALQPLSLREVMLYIQRRLELVRAPRPLFDSVAIATIHYFSAGIPRLINAICDLSLLYAFADTRRLVDVDIVRAVITDRNVTGLSTFSNLERAEDPSLIHEIRTHFDLGETKPALSADPPPVPASEAFAAAAAPSEDAANLLTDVAYSRQVIDVDPVSDAVRTASGPDGASTAFDAANLFYLNPELVTDWPEIKGRAEIMRTTKTRRGTDRESAGKASPRGSLRRRFLPRGDLSEL